MRPDQFLHQFSPEKILKKLEDAVIGQDEAKRVLVAAVWWNLYRAALIEAGCDPKLLPAKLNVLLLGPSGIGKTELARSVASLFHVPWVTTSAPGYSSAGYTGADVDDMLGLLLQAASGDQASAEQGIVVLDEVDKLRRREFNGQSDVGCEAIQQALLALLEGCEAMPRCRGGDRVKMRSHSVTFVGTGAFVGLNVDPGPVPAAALVAEGFIPEFIARSMRIRLQDIDRDMLRKIVMGKRSALHKLSHLFALHGIEFHAEDKAIDLLIQQASAEGIGARIERGALDPAQWADRADPADDRQRRAPRGGGSWGVEWAACLDNPRRSQRASRLQRGAAASGEGGGIRRHDGLVRFGADEPDRLSAARQAQHRQAGRGDSKSFSAIPARLRRGEQLFGAHSGV